MKVCSVCCRCYEDRAVHCAEGSHQALLESRVGDVEMVSGYRLEILEHSTAREDVYRARHVASARSCIIRLIRTSTDRVKDFMRDAEVAASLFHPNVVDIYETGRLDNGDLYAVTEDAAGQSLREMMAIGSPDLMTSIRIAAEAASAIHTMHLKSLVHRAIRPENIILTSDSDGEPLVRVKDADLGGVIERSIVSDKFTIDSARDRLRYFAPEQCNGEKVGIKTDVYSLGIVLYEMLAGRPPFDSPKASGLIEMHRHRRPDEIKIDDFELRMLVTHTLMQSLSKHPSDRQSSANSLARQLRHIEQLATHVSTPPPAGVVPPDPARSSPRIHISDPGPSLEIAAPSNAVEAKQAHDAVSLVARENRSDAISEQGIETLPTPDIEAKNARPRRQWLSRLKRQANRSRVEGVVPSAIDPEMATPISRPAVQSQAFSLDRTTENNLKIGRDPVKINWEQPENDLPSMDDVIAARAETSALPVDAMPVRVPEPIAEPPRSIAVTRPAPVRVAAAAASGGIHLSGIFGTSHHEPDEITAAPMRGNPIRIDIAAPSPMSRREPARKIAPIPADESFFPALPEDVAVPNSPAAPESLLSSFYGDVPQRSVWPAQKAKLAVGVFAAAAAIFAFSNLSEWKYSSSSPGDGRVSASTPSTDAIQPQAAVTAPQAAATRKPLKYSDSPKPKTAAPSESNSDVSRPVASKNQPERDPKTDKKDNSKAPPAARDKSPIKAAVAKRAPDRSFAAASNKPTGTTRPRIVQIPRR